MARFNQPYSIAAAPDGSLYVANNENHFIRHISAEGTVSTLAGGAGGPTKGTVAGLYNVQGLVLSNDEETLYMTSKTGHWVRAIATNVPSNRCTARPGGI